mgnify:CR=1 FL=1|tara:strand:+ start:338 stop:799 length:462 start_codon:yes stop_codon:yes gene_type:complete
MRVKKAYEKFGSRSFVPSAISNTNGVGEGDVLFLGSTSVAAGKAYYLYEVEGSATWGIADADALASSSYILAIAMGSGTASSVGMLLRGVVHISSVTSDNCAGKPIYLSSNQGQLTLTAPSAADSYVRIVGYQVAENKIWFSPDNTHIKIAES